MRVLITFLALLTAATAKTLPARGVLPLKPAPKAAAPVLALRGGGIVEKDLFIKTVAIANAGFGLQFFLTPKMVWEMVGAH